MKILKANTAYYEYKCRRCGKLKDNIEADLRDNQNASWENLIRAINGVLPMDRNPRVPIHEVHSCDDGGYGIADLIGCRLHL